MMDFLFIVLLIIIFVRQSYGKRHEKAIGRARKVVAGGAGLNPG
jgi:hypothetical protein